MRSEEFERIEKKLAPDDELVSRVMAKARELSQDEKAMKEYVRKEGVITMEKNNIEKNNAVVKNRWGLLLTSAAALLLVVGGIAFFSSKTSLPETKAPSVNAGASENEPETAVQKVDSEAEATTEKKNGNDETTEEKTETTADSKADDKPDEASRPEQVSPPFDPSDDDTSQHEDWHADSGEEGTATAHSPQLSAKDEYTSFELDGISYNYASSNKGDGFIDLYQDYQFDAAIPNMSYIGEQLCSVEIPSMYGDIRPNIGAEVYSLRTFDSGYLVAVRYDGEDGFYLFINESCGFPDVESMVNALRLSSVTFGGESLSRRVEKYAGSDDYVVMADSTVLQEKIFALQGERTDPPTGDMVWQTFLDAPLYGGSVSFKWYAEGYVTVVTHWTENTYDIGADAAGEIIDLINNAQ